jgi:hypothetical protein
VRPHAGAFREVVVDRQLPEQVRDRRKWCCKAWWPLKALERFQRVLYCDFDILVRREPDEELDRMLVRAPMFLYMPNYGGPHKRLGCGVVFYDREAPMEAFARLVYEKWNCDERAWSELTGFTRESLLASDRHMNPRIVDYTWLLAEPEQRDRAYIVHGISAVDGGHDRLRRIGFSDREQPFVEGFFDKLRDRLGLLVRRVKGVR